jgi:hypothetical protein
MIPGENTKSAATLQESVTGRNWQTAPVDRWHVGCAAMAGKL